MDIASVYLNLVSLLGTEIEVEGYYAVAHWPERVFLYGIEHEPASERIFLPQFIGHKNLVNTYSAPMRARVFLRGTLTQNARGDLMMRRIKSISYRTEVVVFNVTITYQDDQIICQQRTDLVFNWMAFFQGNHRPLRGKTLASAILSKPLLLKGHLIPYVVNPDKYPRVVKLTMAVEEIIYSLPDLWKHETPPSASDVMQLLLGPLLRWDKTREEEPDAEFGDVGWHNQIWIPPDSPTLKYLDLYFGASGRGDGTYRSRAWDPEFTFAGTITSIDEAANKEHALMPRVRLIFTTIDYITARRTVVYELSRDG
jgi:hypothetical protein